MKRSVGTVTAADVVARVAAHLGLFGRSIDRLVDAIVGGQYGSEGKGHIASYVASEYDLLVRVGGPNGSRSKSMEFVSRLAPVSFTFTFALLETL